MASAFESVAEIEALADRIVEAGSEAEARLRDVVRTTALDAQQFMRRVVPVDEGDTRDSITVEIDGLVASVGPTNLDPNGKPIGFFIENGTDDTAPRPFARPTGKWLAGEFPARAADAMDGLL